MSARYVAAAEAQTPSWRNEVTLRAVENMLQFEAAGWAPMISPKPFLMIVGATDTCTFPELQLEVFECAREPKRLVVHPGGHFDTYTEQFELTSGAALEWFREHLTPVQSDTARQPERRGKPQPDLAASLAGNQR